MSKTYRALIILAVVVAVASFAATLVGCVTYQPPGPDLWRAL
ncbi:hypothetical protein [Rhizobium sp. WYCCWR 11152]|nr:hypothetical protein [Rhizobium sp. WYCCWR 11152]